MGSPKVSEPQHCNRDRCGRILSSVYMHHPYYFTSRRKVSLGGADDKWTTEFTKSIFFDLLKE
jgi:hypothetical protein